MTPREFYETNSSDVKRLVKEAGTSVQNFKLIALYNGSVSRDLAARLASASKGAMTELEILYPERYEKSA